MRLGLDLIRTIKSEVEREGVGWYVGGYVRRQLFAFPFIVLGVLAFFLVEDGIWQNILVAIGIGGWFFLVIVTWAVGTFFACRREDKRRADRPKA